MPVEPNPQPIDAWPRQVNLSAPGMSISVQVQNDGSGTASPADMDTALQSLIDFLQGWPGKIPGSNVTGSKYDTLLYLVSPTNPEPPPDPPEEEPEGEGLTDESPSSVV